MVLKVGVLASGRGSNLQALLDSCRSGRIPAEISLVLSNKREAYALQRAKAAGVEAHFVDPAGRTREEYDEELARRLERAQVDLVALAGYMRILSPSFVRRFPDRIVNIHPALLPSFRGLDAQRQALEAGVRISGATTHFVDEEVDHGPIILQAAVPVLEGDTRDDLAARILAVEHTIYPETIRLIAENRVERVGSRVRIKGTLPVFSTGVLFPPDVIPP